jgi:hypothetical protein
VTDNELDVTINAGFTASGIVVKGGPNANVYDGPFVGPTEVEGMTAPKNASGEPAGISHWFVCGGQPPTTPTTPPPTTNGTTPGRPPTSNGGAAGLPVTGTPVGGIFLAGVGLVVVGLALVAALAAARRRREISDGTEG